MRTRHLSLTALGACEGSGDLIRQLRESRLSNAGQSSGLKVIRGSLTAPAALIEDARSSTVSLQRPVFSSAWAQAKPPQLPPTTMTSIKRSPIIMAAQKVCACWQSDGNIVRHVDEGQGTGSTNLLPRM